MNILLLEDSITDADLTKRGLTNSIAGSTIVVAQTLKQARELFFKNISFDIAILDMKLPDGTGMEMLMELRQTGSDLPVIFLTGSGNEELATQALKAGADDFIIKQEGYLLKLPAVIEYAIRNHMQNKLFLTEIIDVLYIEHHVSDVDLTIRFLNQSGSKIHITAIATAELALDQLPLSNDEKCRFQVILLDYRLPGLDALEFTKIIRQERKLSIPIILVTGHGNEEVAIQALKLGVNEYLVKRDNYLSRLPSMILNAYQHQEIVKKQKALTESEEKYRFMFANNPQPMWIYDLDNLAFLEINDAAIQLYGYTKAEFLSMIINDIRPVEDLHELINEQKHGEAYTSHELRHVKKNREIILVEIISHLLEFNNRKARHVMVTDITKRRRAENELRKLSLAVEQSPNSIVITDTDGTIEYANPCTFRLTGYSPGELIGENPRIFSSGETPVEEYEIVWNTILAGKKWEGEFHNKKKNGELFWEAAAISPIFDENGKIIHFLAIKKDVTEVIRAAQIQKVVFEISRAAIETDNLEQLVTMIQSELGTIIDTTNFFLALYDSKTDTLSLPYFSDEYDNFTSLPTENTITNFVIKSKTPLLADLNKLNELENAGLIGHYGTDALIWLGVPLKMENEVIGVIAVQSYTNKDAYDESDKRMLEFISDQISTAIHRKKTADDLNVALKKAEESDRLKTAFLLNLSHEIRTPMNGILGFAELLKMPGISNEENQEYIGFIKQSSDRMLNIINDLVDISKIESGLVMVDHDKTNINEQTSFVFNSLKLQAEAKGLNLVYRNGIPDGEDIVTTDRKKVDSILSKLVKNAIKFTDTGTIEFGYNVKPFVPLSSRVNEHSPGREDLQEVLEFYVKDTGIGIPADRQLVIFERFMQADIGDKRAFQGAGLGLSIAKGYVEKLGGNIWVESEEGKGSTFRFTMPYLPVQKVTTADAAHPLPVVFTELIKKLKILIVEDDDTSVLLLMMIFKAYSRDTLIADTGTEAVEICRSNPDIDLVLMDIKMSRMDGYEATRQIRRFNKDVVIIAQTAFSQKEDREKASEAGCNEYISKPIRTEELKGLIQKYFLKN